MLLAVLKNLHFSTLSDMKQIKVNSSTALMQKCRSSRLIESIGFENLRRNGVKLNNQRPYCDSYLLIKCKVAYEA